MEFIKLALDDIVVSPARRPCDPERVRALAESMKAINLQTPISVWIPKGSDDAHLVAGRHRLEAARLLGWERIQGVVVTLDERQRRMWEISENLHRAELTVLERSNQIAEWIRLYDEGQKLLEQVAPKAPVAHRPPGGVRNAARNLGLDRDEAKRAARVNQLAPDAKEEARSLHLDDNQTALLKAARETTPEAQVESLRRHANPPAPPAVPPVISAATTNQVAALMTAWTDASHEARDLFLEQLNLVKRRP